MLCCGRVVSCKSAKDRTSMSVTWEQASMLRHNYVCDEKGEQDNFWDILNLTRTYGVRRSNVLKNTGKVHYAFNSLQRQMLPEYLRPPEATCGKTAS
mmetsp:Transcript_5601/g.8718  ORF Transcript_5601/g.8718 Transcript_5601/m.8718 type:complete len:97 (+) Transcript_5601:1266-1556(+)